MRFIEMIGFDLLLDRQNGLLVCLNILRVSGWYAQRRKANKKK